MPVKFKLPRQDGKLRLYNEVKNYLLATYTNESIITEADMGIIEFKNSTREKAFEYLQVLWPKVLGRRPVSDEYRLENRILHDK